MVISTIALVAALALVLANAFFVACEFAYVKVRPTRIRHLVKQGHTRAKLLSGISDNLNPYLSACQLGITVASLALGALGEPAFAGFIEPALRRAGIDFVGPHALALVLGMLVLTFLHTVFGEQVPKFLALRLAEPVALWSAAPMRAFYTAAFPFIWVLNTASAGAMRLLRLRVPSEAERIHSPEELRLVLRQVKLDEGARRLIDRVFDYTHRVARHVMTVRRDVVVLDSTLSFDENLKVAVGNQYTRYPLVEPRTDRVLGYVHIKDVLVALASGRRPENVRELAREPIYVPEDAPLEILRREFQRRRVHIAVVVGPRGAFAGIVTHEDLIEEFVGEIQDEQDVGEVPPVLRHADGSFEADGRLTLDVLAREVGLDAAPSAGVETLGGWMAARLRHLPAPGDQVEEGEFHLAVVAVRDGVVRRVRGRRRVAAEPDVNR